MRSILARSLAFLASSAIISLSSGCQKRERLLRSDAAVVVSATGLSASSSSANTLLLTPQSVAVRSNKTQIPPAFADWAGLWHGGAATYDPPTDEPHGGISVHGFEHTIEVDSNGRVSIQSRLYTQSEGSGKRDYYKNRNSTGQLSRTGDTTTFAPDDPKLDVFPRDAIWRRTQPCILTLFDPKRRGDLGRLYSFRQSKCTSTNLGETTGTNARRKP